MTQKLSRRLAILVDALPLRPGIRVLEIGCGPGAMAREIARRIRTGHVLGIDRSAKAIEQAKAASDTASGLLSFRLVSAEDFVLEQGEEAYDLAIAIRVGALDGRHPQAGLQAKARIFAALKPGAQLFIDGGDPLREVNRQTIGRGMTGGS